MNPIIQNVPQQHPRLTAERNNSKTWQSFLEMDLIELAINILFVGLFAALMLPNIIPHSGAFVLVCSLALLIFFVLRLLKINRPVHISISAGLWIVFTLYVLLNRGLVDAPGSTATRWLLLFPVCLAIAVLASSDYVKWLRKLLVIITIFGTLNAIATITFWIVPDLYSGWFYPTFLSDASYVSNAGYKSGLTTHYSTNGMVLALGLVCCFSLLLQHRAKLRWKIIFAVILFALLLTTKRAHFVFGVAACVAAYAFWNSNKSFSTTYKIVLAAAVALLLLYFASFYVPDLVEVFGRIAVLEDDDSFGGRAAYYQICLNLWESNPLFGCGWDGFTDALYRSGISDLTRLYQQGNLTQDAHNVFFQILAEEGLVGLAFFLAASGCSLVVAIRLLIKSNKKSVSNWAYRSACAGSIAIQSFFLMYCITGNPLYTQMEYIPYLLALVIPFAGIKQSDIPLATTLNSLEANMQSDNFSKG